MARVPSRWLANRDPIGRTLDSRQFVDDVLQQLATSHFSFAAWRQFFSRSLIRSVAQARSRPLAAGEVTVLHLLAGARGNRRWASICWLICITHLGLLGDRVTLGWPNRLTILRALLPAVAPGSRGISLLALATDFADGHLARRGRESAFGAFADPIADFVFWSWYSLRWERSGWLRLAPVTAFAAALTVISAAYFASARTIDYPRPVALRNASGVAQVAMTIRNLRRVTR